MKKSKWILGAVLLVLSTALIGCGQKEEAKTVDLAQCISDSRSDSENALYEAKNKADKGNYIENLGLDESRIKNSAISLCIDGKAYCLAIIETDDQEVITAQLDTFSQKRADELFVEYYDESVIAEDYEIRYFDDYVVFAMCENAEEACNELENSLILAVTAE